MCSSIFKPILVLFALITNIYGYTQKNILKENPTFANGKLHWEYGTWGDATSRPMAKMKIDKTVGQDDSFCLVVNVTKSTKDTPGKVYLKRKGLNLKKGKQYRISFWVRSKLAADMVKLILFSSPETGSSKEWGCILDKNFTFLGDDHWHQITHTFEAKDLYPAAPADYNNVAMEIGFGGTIGTCYLDNIVLSKVD